MKTLIAFRAETFSTHFTLVPLLASVLRPMDFQSRLKTKGPVANITRVFTSSSVVIQNVLPQVMLTAKQFPAHSTSVLLLGVDDFVTFQNVNVRKGFTAGRTVHAVLIVAQGVLF